MSFWDELITVLDSTGFQTIVALFVGGFVFVQYYINKKDRLRDIASLIVVEIQTGTRISKDIKKTLGEGRLESDVSVMPSNSWREHRQLFSKFLDRDEWDMLEDFYNRAELLDDSVKYNSQMFRNDVEQIRINKQRAAADFAIDTVNKIDPSTNREGVAENFSSKFQIYDALYMSKQGEIAYAPNRVVDDAKKYIDNMPDILNSSVYEKMKKISKKAKV